MWRVLNLEPRSRRTFIRAESTDLPIDQVAAACGFGSTVTMRQSFTAAVDTPPSTYRRRWSVS